MMRVLDRFATDEPGFRKPRRGACPLCSRPTIEHPCARHRIAALLALVAARWP